MRKPFLIEIASINNSTKLTNNIADTMILRVTDVSSLKEDKVIFNYGYQDSIDEEFKGKFMNVFIWEKTRNHSQMDIAIFFKRKAHRKRLEIFTFATQNHSRRREILRNPNLAKRIFFMKISLYLPAQLNISVHPLNETRREILANDIVVATCKATIGIPRNRPIFITNPKIQILKTNFSENKNELIIHFRVSLNNHLTNLICNAGNSSLSFVLRINHHPSKLYIKPIIKKRLRSNSTISCYNKDGYPNPEIKWQLISGPPDPSLYFKIINNGSTIYMNTNNLPGSMWQFKCVMKSTFLNTTKILDKNISFIIAKNAMKNCDLKCLNLRMTEIEESMEDNNIDQMKIFINQLSIKVNGVEKSMKSWINSMGNFQNKIDALDSQINMSRISFQHIFNQTTYFIQYSPYFKWTNNINAQMGLDFYDSRHQLFRFWPILTSTGTFSRPMNIRSTCTAMRYTNPKKYKSLSQSIIFSGGYTQYYSTVINSNELFNSNNDTKVVITCLLVSRQ